MKSLYISAFILASGVLFTACDDDEVKEQQPSGDPVITLLNEPTVAYFADSLKIEAIATDNAGVDLSTLKVYLQFGDETVAEQTIRTRTAGKTYQATLYVPFLANIPNGNATLGLKLENVTGASTTQELQVSVSRPMFENIKFVSTDGNEYSLAHTSDYNYSITSNFNRRMSGYIVTPAYGANGNSLTFGMSSGAITLGADKPINFSNSASGEYTISFNTLTFDGAPFITVSNLVDFATSTTTDADLEQGQTVAFSGIDVADYYLSPDFFRQETDGSYTFNAISGTYRLVADDNLGYVRIYPIANDDPATLNDDGTGALWIIGDGIGLPSIKGNEVGWNTDKAICMAQVSSKVHQLTLIAGRSVSADNINFKFFGQMGWGIELTGDKLTSTSDIVLVGDGTDHDNGNLYLADERTLDANGIYTFTVDLSNGTSNGVLSVEKIGEVSIEAEQLSVNGIAMETIDNVEFSATLSLSQGSTISFAGLDGIADYWVSPDVFSGIASSLTLAAVSGEYKIVVDKDAHTIVAQSTTTTLTDDGHGTIWILGNGIGTPSLATEPGWNPGKGCALTEVASNIFQFSGIAGDEGDATIGTRIRISGWNLKFFHQDGWGGEFGGADISVAENSVELINVDADSGNVTLKTDLESGAQYTIQLDLTDGLSNAVLSLLKN